MNTEPLYTPEDIRSEAYLVSQEKNIPYQKAYYFARMKRGRESLKLARGLEPHTDTFFAAPDDSSGNLSVFFLAFCHELEDRGLVDAVKKAAQGVPQPPPAS